jgi:hypothetical protein
MAGAGPADVRLVADAASCSPIVMTTKVGIHAFPAAFIA